MTEEKKAYQFGTIEKVDFDDLMAENTQNTKHLKIYALIPACDGDGGGGYYQDPCLSMN